MRRTVVTASAVGADRSYAQKKFCEAAPLLQSHGDLAADLPAACAIAADALGSVCPH